MLSEEIKNKIRFLKITFLSENWDNFLTYAAKKDFSFEKFLIYVVDELYKKKMERARETRLSRADIPERYIIETFPFERQPKLSKKRILSLYDSFDYITNCKNIIWIGQTGAGKTGLATSFLINAINKGYSGRFVSFVDLIDELFQSIADSSSKAVLKRYQKYDCLLIDEMGYVEMDAAQVGLFFRLMQYRHKKKTTFITTNLGFSEWVSFLKNDQLTSALVDRLTENSYVFNMKGCKSLRSNQIEPQDSGE